MLKLYVAPQLEEFQSWIMFQQDGAPPHWGSHVRRLQNFQTGGLEETVRHPGHQDRRTSSPLDFFLWRYVKVKVFSTPVPDITYLKGKNNTLKSLSLTDSI